MDSRGPCFDLRGTEESRPSPKAAGLLRRRGAMCPQRLCPAERVSCPGADSSLTGLLLTHLTLLPRLRDLLLLPLEAREGRCPGPSWVAEGSCWSGCTAPCSWIQPDLCAPPGSYLTWACSFPGSGPSSRDLGSQGPGPPQDHLWKSFPAVAVFQVSTVFPVYCLAPLFPGQCRVIPLCGF